ncbi:Serine/threonine-protein kinase PK-1 [compost metagenome]
MELITTEARLRFTFLEQAGIGGEATVFKAKDLQLNSTIAIKRILKSSFTDESKYFLESQKLHEAEHSFVVPIKFGCWDDDHVYLGMPYYVNGSLKDLMDKRFLTTREVVSYSRQFLSGLNSIHSKGLLHFDIKPENILINDAGQACVSDFGLAQYTGGYGFATVAGTTPIFAPPELFVQAQHNLKFDVYQSGLAMYRMCNGDKIFQEQANNAFISRGIIADVNFIKNLNRGKFPDRGNYLPHMPKKLRLLINKAMNPDPNKRYSTVIDMLNDLNQLDVNDWQYSIDGDTEKWEKLDYVVTCSLAKGYYVMTAIKNGRRKRDFCRKISLADKNSVTYNCLNTRW